MNLQIEKRSIGNGVPIFIIAEAGVNHNGDLAIAKELIVAAKDAGADCVKFQTFKAEKLVTRSAIKANYQIANMGTNESQLEMLRKLELNDSQFRELIDFSSKTEILFLTTPYSVDDLVSLRAWNVSALKIASAMSVEPRFVRAAAELNVPLFLSVGMATLDEICLTWSALLPEMRARTILLHCTTNYPADPLQANLRALQTLHQEFGALFGYSDHTPGYETSLMALAMGASVLEKHLTLDKTMSGPDHAASLDPRGFKDYVDTIRAAEQSLGTGVKVPAVEELQNIEKMRRSLVSARDLYAHQRIEEKDLNVKRPATGIPPRDWNQVIGRSLKRNIAVDTVLMWEMFE